MKDTTGTVLAKVWVLPAWLGAPVDIIGSVFTISSSVKDHVPVTAPGVPAFWLGAYRETERGMGILRKCVSGDSTLSSS